MKTILVSLVGNPNVGKTTLLNRLAGSALKVGNWSGVTIERKEASARWGDYEIRIVDLPGIYTLEPVSEAEKIAVDFVTEANVDVVVNVVDATNLPRNLVLTTELLEFGKPTVLVFNMIDEAERMGVRVDAHRAEEMLGVGAVATNGRTGEGVEGILAKIVQVYENGGRTDPPSYGGPLDEALAEAERRLGVEGLERRRLIERLINDGGLAEVRKELEQRSGKGVDELVDEARWNCARAISDELSNVVRRVERTLTDRLDGVLLHPYLGVIIYVAVFYLIFKVSIDFSAPYMDWIDSFLNGFVAPLFAAAALKISAPMWIVRFFSEGIIGGAGFVLTFVPLVATIYLFITVLEMSGYLPRIAFIMDRFMHRIGLHGNMITPLLLGFGCNVPAIMATRSMRSRRDKFIVVMMIPFMSCPARLVVFAFFATTFFTSPALVISALYVLGIIVAVATALLLRRSFFKSGSEHFVLELPPYRMPSRAIVSKIVLAHVKMFLTRAGTAIVAVAMVVWFLLNLPLGVKDTSRSYVASIGRALTPVFAPIGLGDWRLPASLIPAFLARELSLSSLGVIYKADEKEDLEERVLEFDPGRELIAQGEGLARAVVASFRNTVSPVPSIFDVGGDTSAHASLRSKVSQSIGPLSALSFMLLILVYNSCIATFSVMMRELGKAYAFSFLVYSFAVGWVLAFVVYHLGARLVG